MHYSRLPECLKIPFVRFSHVGRRNITLSNNLQAIFECSGEKSAQAFKKTKVASVLKIRGPLGQLCFPIHHGLKCQIEPGLIEGERQLKVDVDKPEYGNMSKYQKKFVMSMWGTTASHIRRMVAGVQESFQIPVRLAGVGYKAELAENTILLRIGFSHPVNVPVPPGIKVTLSSPTKLILNGIDFQKVTQFAAQIRSRRKPEPYSGKGIFVGSETIKIKDGKKK